MSVTLGNIEKLLETKINNVCDVLMTTLAPKFQHMTTIDYRLDESTYDQMADSETWAHHILASVKRFSAALESELTPENYSKVKRMVKRTSFGYLSRFWIIGFKGLLPDVKLSLCKRVLISLEDCSSIGMFDFWLCIFRN